jgi:hypothetical protein
MPRDDNTALADATHAANVTNAALTLLQAMNSDIDSARGLAIMARIMCRDNPAARFQLAVTLVQMARELFPSLPILPLARLRRRLH